jgi:hypothetical protein
MKFHTNFNNTYFSYIFFNNINNNKKKMCFSPTQITHDTFDTGLKEFLQYNF